MNKKELIEKIEALTAKAILYLSTIWSNFTNFYQNLTAG